MSLTLRAIIYSRYLTSAWTDLITHIARQIREELSIGMLSSTLWTEANRLFVRRRDQSCSSQYTNSHRAKEELSISADIFYTTHLMLTHGLHDREEEETDSQPDPPTDIRLSGSTIVCGID